MGDKKPRLGIMGGTFDPIHYGHLVAAETARHVFGLEKVLFIPTGLSPHKKNASITSPELRCKMVEEGIKDNDAFILSKIEIERSGPSYTVDTLSELTKLYPDYDLFFITGADAFRQIFTWRNPEEILRLAHLIGATRPDFDAKSFLQEIELERQDIGERMHLMEVPALAISSTDIRKRVECGQSIRYLLPEVIRLFIIEKGLYTTRRFAHTI